MASVRRAAQALRVARATGRDHPSGSYDELPASWKLVQAALTSREAPGPTVATHPRWVWTAPSAAP
ncbi:MAG TPA: hypothetical protein VHX88_15075 [Solirubrobacteraceae bacterium]|nr:hypothetical protein [Solirubrobacteraceae bacterium]